MLAAPLAMVSNLLDDVLVSERIRSMSMLSFTTSLCTLVCSGNAALLSQSCPCVARDKKYNVQFVTLKHVSVMNEN
jgi:hypothetical protein